MRILNQFESLQISGGVQNSIYDGIIVGGAFSCLFGIVGGAGGIFWYLDSVNKVASLSTVFATVSGYPVVTFPVALFAGVGAAGFVGAAVGMGLYYSGFAIKPE